MAEILVSNEAQTDSLKKQRIKMSTPTSSQHWLSKFYPLITIVLIVLVLITHSSEAKKKDVQNRKSIVFDIKTPKVFYCPQEKQSDKTKTIVKAKSLDKLCEYDGLPKPRGAHTDCYNDVDETEFACEEKRRFMLRLTSPQE